MRQIHFRSFRNFVRRLQHRQWIRNQLAQAGGADYLRRLEEDIGAEPGHFRKALEAPLFSVNRGNRDSRRGASDGQHGWTLTLPAHRLPAGKC